MHPCCRVCIAFRSYKMKFVVLGWLPIAVTTTCPRRITSLKNEGVKQKPQISQVKRKCAYSPIILVRALRQKTARRPQTRTGRKTCVRLLYDFCPRCFAAIDIHRVTLDLRAVIRLVFMTSLLCCFTISSKPESIESVQSMFRSHLLGTCSGTWTSTQIDSTEMVVAVLQLCFNQPTKQVLNLLHVVESFLQS